MIALMDVSFLPPFPTSGVQGNEGCPNRQRGPKSHPRKRLREALSQNLPAAGLRGAIGGGTHWDGHWL